MHDFEILSKENSFYTKISQLPEIDNKEIPVIKPVTRIKSIGSIDNLDNPFIH